MQRGLRILLVTLAITALPCATFAADMEILPKPTEKAAPAATPKPSLNIFKQRELTGSNNACTEWTDGCRTCQRNSPDSFTCSNVGIACVQTVGRCTRSEKQ